ncbi:MerR family transcriptional regulator [Vibrio sp.]|uniref:MerR family transcriptional regulator n=1 Tax=Vibrio viridaestus TaxID=2487322 RepID=A0A3N9TKW3_9VIBR|nr:MerR family transcriptional regulator [Vibrio viridaestus]MDC0611935.1 MerR family transcriptional regulator [Vibrio sp.]RQW64920.1 MerR family transcriptional regulator [Vibrio viridaestus]
MDCKQPLYAIREVSEITGVKPVTLRAWQRRYNLIQPQRTEKGHRLFSADDVEKIQQIQSWLSKGVSIGKVSSLLDQTGTLERLPQEELQHLEEYEAILDALTELKQSKLAHLVNSVMKEYPLDIVSNQLLFPVIDAIDKMKGPSRSLRRALFQSVLMTKISLLIDSESRVSKKGRCLFISLDPVGSLYAWLKAAEIVEQGEQITILDGVEELSGLISYDMLNDFSSVFIFSNRALNENQLQGIQLLQQSDYTGAIGWSDVIAKLHELEPEV